MKSKNNKQTASADYDYCDFDYKNGMIIVGKDGKFGYLNSKGEALTPLKYDKALRFYWGAGSVCLNGKWGLVDKNGNEITPPIYDKITGHQSPVVKLDKKYGYLNRETGALLTPIKYDYAEKWTQLRPSSDDQKFGDSDLAKVKLNKKWGCIDVHGNEIIPLKYDEIIISQSEHPPVLARIEKKWGFINGDGKELTAIEYDEIDDFSEGRACVSKNGKYGFIDTQGAVVIPVIYDNCDNEFQNSYAEIKNECFFHITPPSIPPIWVELNGKYGYIDINGNEIIAPLYEDAYPFCVLAAVQLNGKAGFIDETGKTVIPFMYEPDFEGEHNYLFSVKDNVANVKLNGKWGVIDKENNVIIPFVYDKFFVNSIAGWRCALRDDQLYSIDTKGVERLLPKNPDARTFADYLQKVEWDEVKEQIIPFLGRHGETDESRNKALSIHEINFNNLRSKPFRASWDIIRIYEFWSDRPGLSFCCIAHGCSYVFVDWNILPDMEVRIEDNLALSDATVVALCLSELCYHNLGTEEKINGIANVYSGMAKSVEENENGKILK